jgi:RNA-directed DNA polymerase
MSWTDTYMPTSLRGIANRAIREPEHRFGDLYRLLNEQNLRWCFYQLRRRSAPGVDKVTFEQYERNLEDNLADLVERLKGKRYRAKLVRRKHIPKGNGKTRPLGIPALEDKLLQLAAAKILSAIYEGDFLECSWGYRGGRGAREAGRVLADTLCGGRYGWIVEADIKGFFDHLDHDWMVEMLEKRVNDRALTQLIRKWMKAGVLEEDGKVLHPATGTPQGGIISPVLSNIYLHYVLDLWFEKVVKKHCEGDAYMMRYADDFVCAFEHKADAKRFEAVLGRRLGKFQLSVAPEKTRTLQFSRYKDEPNEAFEFLGFEFRWVRRRTGRMGVRRRTAPRKLNASVRAMKEWIIEHRNQRISVIMAGISRKLRGYWGYYGVRGNFRSLSKLYNACLRLLFKWLNRRSQRRSYNWAGFKEMLKHFNIPAPRIIEPVHQKELFS